MARDNNCYFDMMKMAHAPVIGICILLFIFAIQGSQCLRNVNIVAPAYGELNQSVNMICQFELEREALYTVKWYRGEKEFCRYTPRDVPPLRIFPIPGIDVVRDRTDGVYLLMIPRNRQTAQGIYTCEVSADEPSFQTAQVQIFLYVVELPKSFPDLLGIKLRYKVGMKLKAECVSRDSLPAANLSFYINDNEALSQHILQRVDVNSTSGLMTAYSILEFVVQRHHIRDGKIKIRCMATIYSIFYKSHEKCAFAEDITTTPSSQIKEDITETYYNHRRPKTTHRVGNQERRKSSKTNINQVSLLQTSTGGVEKSCSPFFYVCTTFIALIPSVVLI